MHCSSVRGSSRLQGGGQKDSLKMGRYKLEPQWKVVNVEGFADGILTILTKLLMADECGGRRANVET